MHQCCGNISCMITTVAKFLQDCNYSFFFTKRHFVEKSLIVGSEKKNTDQHQFQKAAAKYEMITRFLN